MTMKKNIFVLGLMLLSTLYVQAQSECRITGKIQGVQDGTIILVASNPENGSVDTLGRTTTINGEFEFKCNTNDITAGFVVKSDNNINIPVIIENTDIQINISANQLSVKGGKGQELFNQFYAIGAGVTKEQQRLDVEFQTAQKAKNKAKMNAIQQEFAEYVKKSQEQELELIKSNPDNYVTAYVIASAIQQTNPDELVARYYLLGDKAKNTTFGRVIGGHVKRIERVAIGATMPDFALKTPEGSPITLKSITGKVKLLEFWASFNETCRDRNVDLVKLYRDYMSSGLEILSISFDETKELWMKAVGEDGMTWAQASDLLGPRSPLFSEFYIQNIPFNILLDKENRIVAKNIEGKELQDKIKELLKAQKDKK